MRILLLRHAQTPGNREQRYIGVTDEAISGEGAAQLAKKQIARPDALYVSPMLRCRQSAKLLFPEMEQRCVEDFRECDFGEFENKNYRDLAKNPAYQAWIDSGGTLPFPKGESLKAFQRRCVRAFGDVLREAQADGSRRIACVVHGGTIMAILEKTAWPKRNYFDYQVKNGCGYEIEWENPDEEEIRCVIKGEL